MASTSIISTTSNDLNTSPKAAPLAPAQTTAIILKMAATISEKHPSITMEQALETARVMEPLMRDMKPKGRGSSSPKPKKRVKRGKNAYMYYLGANRPAIKEDLSKTVEALKDIVSNGGSIEFSEFPEKHGGPDGEISKALQSETHAGSIYARCKEFMEDDEKTMDDLKVTVTDVTKRAGAIWSSMDDTARKPFNDMAAAEKAKLTEAAEMADETSATTEPDAGTKPGHTVDEEVTEDA